MKPCPADGPWVRLFLFLSSDRLATRQMTEPAPKKVLNAVIPGGRFLAARIMLRRLSGRLPLLGLMEAHQVFA